MGNAVATVVIFGGALISVLAFLHDIRRLRLAEAMPQAAPSRMPPEIHAVATMMTCGGAGMLGGWPFFAVVLIAHGALAFLTTRLIERFL